MTTSHTTADAERTANLIRNERTMRCLGITFEQVKADPAIRQQLKDELGRRGWLPSSPVITGQVPAVGSPLIVMV